MTAKKERLDVLLVERGLMETREKAKRAIMAGIVYSNENRLDKPGEKIERDLPLTVKGNPLKYVSRGGLKLEKALQEFPVSVEGKIMIDVGSSTGGFTDCALQNGAKQSYAVDVGYNQLAWKLRQDERVVVMERTNFRYATAADFTKGLPEFATIDVSFISLRLILPVLKTLLVSGSDCIALVKPQFEAGRESVGKKASSETQRCIWKCFSAWSGLQRLRAMCAKACHFHQLPEETGTLNSFFTYIGTETDKTGLSCQRKRSA